MREWLVLGSSINYSASRGLDGPLGQHCVMAIPEPNSRPVLSRVVSGIIYNHVDTNIYSKLRGTNVLNVDWLIIILIIV